MKSGVIVIVDRFAAVVAGINTLASTRVMVGVPSSRAGRKVDKGKGGETVNNAILAYVHDNGSPEAGIPARPFMMPGIANAKEKITKALENAATAALDGNPARVTREYHRAGLAAMVSIKLKITTGPFIPLKPATLAARRRRGVTRTKPLIDTGGLINSIGYVIQSVGRKG